MSDILSKRYNLDNFEAPFREFLQNKAQAGQAPPLQNNSIKNYLSDVRHFMGFMSVHASNESDELLTLSDIEAYKSYLVSENLPLKSINRRLSTLRKFCTFCIQQNWMKENMAKRVGNVGVIQGRDALQCVSTEESKDPVEIVYNDIISKFKQYLLSEQAKPARRDVINHVSTDVNLIVDDVQEFLLICHPA